MGHHKWWWIIAAIIRRRGKSRRKSWHQTADEKVTENEGKTAKEGGNGTLPWIIKEKTIKIWRRAVIKIKKGRREKKKRGGAL